MKKSEGRDYLKKYIAAEARRVDKFVKEYKEKHGVHPIEAMFGKLKGMEIDAIAYQRESRGWY